MSEEQEVYYEVEEGWLKHAQWAVEAIKHLAKARNGEVHIDQVKQKFGDLRIYTTVISEDEGTALYEGVEAITLAAAHMCEVTCEICGEVGTRGSHKGWLNVLCDKHWEERKKI